MNYIVLFMSTLRINRQNDIVLNICDGSLVIRRCLQMILRVSPIEAPQTYAMQLETGVQYILEPSIS